MSDELKEEDEATPSKDTVGTEDRAKLANHVRAQGENAVADLTDKTDQEAMREVVDAAATAAGEQGMGGVKATAAKGSEPWAPPRKDDDA